MTGIYWSRYNHPHRAGVRENAWAVSPGEKPTEIGCEAQRKERARRYERECEGIRPVELKRRGHTDVVEDNVA